MRRTLVTVLVLTSVCVVVGAASTAGATGETGALTSPGPAVATGPIDPASATAEQGPTRCRDVGSDGAAIQQPIIADLYPNPVTDGDAGEFVTVRVPAGSDADDGTNLTLDDGESRISVPDTFVGNSVSLATDPGAVPSAIRENVTEIQGSLALSNAGETLRLRAGNRTLDCVRYSDAPEGEMLSVDPVADERAPTWTPAGRTDFGVARAGRGEVRAFVLPDASEVPLATLRAADERLLLAAYTLTSKRVEATLLAAERRDVDVRVLVDRDPVGGMSTRQRRVLDNLTAAGVQVSAPGGPHARYEFHHAKYAVVDERALVTTENWKPSGTGGRSSRGWGVVTSQDRVVERLVAVFDADARWRAARSWPAVREDVETAEGNVSAGTYPERVDPERLRVDGARVLIGPENAEGAVLDLLQGATESIDVVQMGVGGADQPFLQAVVGAARRGVEVRVLLSGAWYVADDNREVVDHLRGVADAESLPLEARLAEPRGRFEKIHAKGVVVDGDRVLLGSLNWNNHSARENREIALVLEGESVAAYYGRVFRQDWRGPAETVPVGLLLGCIVAIAIALLRAAAVRFDAGRF